MSAPGWCPDCDAPAGACDCVLSDPFAGGWDVRDESDDEDGGEESEADRG